MAITRRANSGPPFKDLYAAKLASVTPSIQAFADSLLRKTATEDIYIQAAIKSYVSILTGNGKRVRAVLTLTGYQLYGGTKMQVAHTAAGIIEACHTYLLVIDDIADNSNVRRHQPTAHVSMGSFLADNHVQGNTAKLGQDMALAAALYAQHKAQSALLRLPIPLKQKILAANVLNEGLARTGIGQLRDMSPLVYTCITTKTILKTVTYKTAYYTFLLPLQIGAILAGATREMLPQLEHYSLNAGLAFQIQDDIIGSFGSEAESGKSPISDIKEGKKTILVVKALEKLSKKADQTEHAVLLAALGNPALTQREFKKCLAIIRATGALEEARLLVTKHTDLAIASLDSISAEGKWPPEHLQFLRELALFGMKRQV